MSSQELKCLFGYHKYTIPWEKDEYVLICENCKRVGYYKYADGYEAWFDFDEKGNIIHSKILMDMKCVMMVKNGYMKNLRIGNTKNV